MFDGNFKLNKGMLAMSCKVLTIPQSNDNDEPIKIWSAMLPYMTEFITEDTELPTLYKPSSICGLGIYFGIVAVYSLDKS